jgi:hypothetical protein
MKNKAYDEKPSKKTVYIFPRYANKVKIRKSYFNVVILPDVDNKK